jgi:hypothetical protein
MPAPNFMQLGVYVLEPEPISAKYFIKPSYLSVCIMCISLSLLGNGSINSYHGNEYQATTKGLLDASLSMRVVFYQRK